MQTDLIWIEVWIEGIDQDSVLLLRKFRSGILELYDPQIKIVVAQFNSYEEASTWLVDEEFSFVDGRMDMDD